MKVPKNRFAVVKRFLIGALRLPVWRCPAPPARMVDASSGYDVAGVARLVSRRSPDHQRTERSVFRDRFVAIQPNLDESLWRLWGQLPARGLSSFLCGVSGSCCWVETSGGR